ncbi:hypothetical protein TRVL_09232 [Trypanosoma vivax]|nr:hypothetical protein TRVL_09232 [Trypanosoma vivax]
MTGSFPADGSISRCTSPGVPAFSLFDGGVGAFTARACSLSTRFPSFPFWSLVCASVTCPSLWHDALLCICFPLCRCVRRNRPSRQRAVCPPAFCTFCGGGAFLSSVALCAERPVFSAAMYFFAFLARVLLAIRPRWSVELLY